MAKTLDSFLFVAKVRAMHGLSCTERLKLLQTGPPVNSAQDGLIRAEAPARLEKRELANTNTSLV